MAYKGIRQLYLYIVRKSYGIMTEIYFICGLFNEAVSSSASNDRMHNELERIWKEVVVAYVQSRHLPAGTKGNHEKL
jgi:hypothetical protein